MPEENTPRKTVLKEISQELMRFDFDSLDLLRDKAKLMEVLNAINVKLDGLLRGFQ